MKKQHKVNKIFSLGIGAMAILVILELVVASVAASRGGIARGGVSADLIMFYGMIGLILWWLAPDKEARDLGGAFVYMAPVKAVQAVRRAHQRTFIRCRLHERGAIAANLKPHPQKTNNRASGRQSGAKTDKKQSSGSKSDDSDGGDGEPPRPLPFYSYKTLAQLLDCSEKTLRNQVSAGKIPRPIQTIVGPRFPIEIVQSLLSTVKKPEQKQTARPRGRPRIALAVRGGAA